MSYADTIAASLPPSYVPRTPADSEQAMARGWWISRIDPGNELGPRLYFTYRDGRTRTTVVLSREINPRTIEQMAIVLGRDEPTPRRQRGPHPPAGT